MASSELLKQIQAGRSLKKAATNDRSGPHIDAKKAGGSVGGRGGAGIGSAAASAVSGRSNGASSAPAVGGGPPQLGGLFAGGMPKLKPAASTGTTKMAGLAKPPPIPRSATSSAPAPADPPPPPPERPFQLPPRAPPRAPPTAPSVVSAATDASGSSAATSSVPSLPPRRNVPPHAAPPPPPPRSSTIGRPVPPPPSRHAATPSSDHLPTAPPSLPARKLPPPPSSTSTISTRAVPPPPPPRATGSSFDGLPKRAAPPPPPARPAPHVAPPSRSRVQSAVSNDSPSHSPSPSRSNPPPAHASAPSRGPPPPPQRTRTVSAAPAILAHETAEVQRHGRASPATDGEGRRSASAHRNTLHKPRVASLGSSLNGILRNTRPVSPARKIPSPPPTAGTHTFPISKDFPRPRPFVPQVKSYPSGNGRGCEYDLKTL